MVFPGQMRFLFAFLALVIPGCLAGSIWPGDWHFSVELHRWSDGLCGDEVSERELLEAGGCVGKHAFTSFSYRVHKHFNSEYVKQMRMIKNWAKYSNCTIMLYKDKHCVGQSHASLFEANDPEQFADCFAFRQESRSAGLICEIDGVQQNEADPGDDDPLYCFDPKHAEECESHSGH